MGTKIGSPMRGQKSGTSSGTFLTDGPTGGDRDNSGNKNIGAFAKEVMKLDKEPPRRPGPHQGSDDPLTPWDLKNLHAVFKALGGLVEVGEEPEGHVTVDALHSKLVELGYTPERINQYGLSEVELMIWEVDDDGDGMVSWREFVTMYRRGKADRSANEPTQLFYIVQFMCMDKNMDGRVSAEECMEVVILRHGRSILDQVFVHDDRLEDITLSEFLLRLEDVPKIPWTGKVGCLSAADELASTLGRSHRIDATGKPATAPPHTRRR